MQKTLTARDYTLFGMLTAVIILIFLAMHQRDREWEKLVEMENSLAEQSRDISNMRGLVSQIQRKLAAVETGNLSISSTDSAADVYSNNIPPAFTRAYQASQLPDYAQGGWFTTSFAGTLPTITPLISGTVNATTVQSYVLEPLISIDPDTLEWQGTLARSWQISDDGLTITYQLRDDVVFSDGHPFDASDVVFSFNFVMNEKIQAPRDRAYLKRIDSVTANGKYEVVFKFKEPYFQALAVSGLLTILAEHFYRPYLDTPEEFNQSKGLLFGTGPYRLKNPKSWKPDQDSVELVRNSRYWGPVQPSYDRVVWRIIQNESARLITYRNGKLDVYDAVPALDFDKLKTDEQIKAMSNSFNYASPLGGYSYIGWNQKQDGKATRFKDKRVRQAMTWLINKQQIIEDIFLGYNKAAVSPFGEGSKQHNPNLTVRKQDIDKGIALLKEAGFEDRDNDGIIENEKGEPFIFKLSYAQGRDSTKRLVLLLKDMYARAGIKLVPDPTEWPVLIEKLDTKDFDAVTLGWGGGTIEKDLHQIFHSSQTQTNGDNYISYENTALDKIIEQARRTTDEDKRMALWQQAEAILYDDLPYTFLLQGMKLGFISKRIENQQMYKLGLNVGMIPVENYISVAQQKHAN